MSSSRPDRDPSLRSASRTWVDNPDEPTIVVPRPASGLPEAPAEVKEASGAETEITAEAPAEEAEAAAREPEVPIAAESPGRAREDPAEARKPSGSQQAGAIPREPPDLLPRPDLLAELDRPDARVLELHSVSGAGATQLAAAYARARLDEGWRLVAWVSAGDTGTLLAGLAAIADALGLSESATAQDRTDPGEMLRRWLETAGDRCLLVLDGVTDPEALRPFIPAEGAARVVITSRQKSDLGRPVPVGAFSADEALAFLAERTGLVGRGRGSGGRRARAPAAGPVAGRRADRRAISGTAGTWTGCGGCRPEEEWPVRGGRPGCPWTRSARPACGTGRWSSSRCFPAPGSAGTCCISPGRRACLADARRRARWTRRWATWPACRC